MNISTGAGGLAQGIFLDPNGTVNSNSSNIVGRIFGGDGASFPFNGGSNITAPGSGAAPALTTTPSPTAVTLGATAPPILTDSATLSGGNSPTGTITFDLFQNGGSTPVHTEVVNVSGNGTYTTPTGFTLATSGTVTGIYQWDTFFSGNAPRNNTASDVNATDEQVTVSPGSTSTATAIMNAATRARPAACWASRCSTRPRSLPASSPRPAQ